jgi:hypothetical protein
MALPFVSDHDLVPGALATLHAFAFDDSFAACLSPVNKRSNSAFGTTIFFPIRIVLKSPRLAPA